MSVERLGYPCRMDLAFIAKRMDAYERLVRLDKPIGWPLLLWPPVWAGGLAGAVSSPSAKRFLPLPQAYLGIAFGFGIPMAYAAIQNRLPAVCWLLLAANVCYSFAYDTEYAMVDRDDDARLGIRTSALTLGDWDVAAVMASYGAMLAILAGVGVRAGLHAAFYAGLGVAAAMMAYHWFLIRGRSREGCFRAFIHNNWVGAAVFAGIIFG